MNLTSCPQQTPAKRLCTAIVLTLALMTYRTVLAGEQPGGAREAKIQDLQPISGLVASHR